MSQVRVPATLLRQIVPDLRPVQPLAAPWRRTLAFAPLGLCLLVGLPAVWGWRSNLGELGPLLAWGVSGAQALAGLLLIGLGLRESIPGRDLSRRTVTASLIGAVSLVVGVTALTDLELPTRMPAGVEWRYAWECFWMAAGPGLLAVGITLWLVSRARPGRPALAGALCGLGTGLMADAGARLFCWVSTPAHVLVSHGGALLVLTLVAAAGAAIVERRRAASGAPAWRG